MNQLNPNALSQTKNTRQRVVLALAATLLASACATSISSNLDDSNLDSPQIFGNAEAIQVLPAESHVNLQSLHVQDASRNRNLPINVYTPDDTVTHPLIVFAKGRFSHAVDYTRFITKIVQAGYVVAAPGFPNNDLSDFSQVKADWPEKARDVSYVITTVEQDPTIKPKLTPNAIGVVGHSDGAVAALMVGCNAPVKDTRISAIVSMDGADVFGAGNCTNLLLTHGSEDTTQPISGSQNAYSLLKAQPKYFATIVGAKHFEHIMGDVAPFTAANDAVVIAFLNQTLQHHGDVAAVALQIGAGVSLVGSP